MEELVKDKVCIVTGAGRGIGMAIAQKLAENGGIIYAVDCVSGVVDEWAQNYSNVTAVTADITDINAIKSFVMLVKKNHGRIDVVVNNAGIEYNDRIGMIPDENIRKMFDVNVFAMIHIIQQCSRVMMRNPNGGSIINISSRVGMNGNPGQLAYAASKGAVIALTKSAAKELGPYQIRVNSIAPGLTNTKMMQAVDVQALKGRISRICMGRVAEPADIANAVLFLASDLSGYVSSQVIGVDGCTII